MISWLGCALLRHVVQYRDFVAEGNWCTMTTCNLHKHARVTCIYIYYAIICMYYGMDSYGFITLSRAGGGDKTVSLLQHNGGHR